MVAIKSHEADRFLTQLPPHVFLYLVFGPNAGLASERKHQIIRSSVDDPSDPFQYVQMVGDVIATEPMLLVDEANTISLFGGKRAISITMGSRNFIPAVEILLKVPPRDSIIILEGGALKRDSAYRKLLEPARTAATIECYPDGPKEIEQMIRNTVAAAQINIDADAMSALTHMLGADRLLTRTELEKLILFVHGRKTIALSDVEAIIADASALATDAAVSGAFAGNVDVVDEIVGRAFANGIDSYVLLSAALRHSSGLQRARSDLDNGGSFEHAIGTMTRTGSYVSRESLELQLRLWSPSRLQRIIKDLSEIIGKSRRETKLAASLTLRALWSISRIAQNGRR